MTIRMIRRKLARAVSGTGLPGAGSVSNLIRTKEDNQELEEMVGNLVSSYSKREEMAKRVAQAYPSVARWMTAEKIELAKDAGGKLLIESAIYVMGDYGTDEQIGNFFEKYVVDDDTFEATLFSFAHMWRHWAEWGYIIEQPDTAPRLNISDEDLVILNDRSLGYVALKLAAANRSLTYDLVKEDLLKIFE